jgi:hypothetical protein
VKNERKKNSVQVCRARLPWVNRVDSAMFALRPLMRQERLQSGHGNTSHSANC